MFFFPPQCGTTVWNPCTFEHAELNCASCSNSITPASTQVPHWSPAPLDGVIRPAVHFIVYTPRNGDICKKANKNIPGARNSPGISAYTWLRFLECTRLFSQNHRSLRERTLIPDSWIESCFFFFFFLKRDDIENKLDAIFNLHCHCYWGVFGALRLVMWWWRE